MSFDTASARRLLDITETEHPWPPSSTTTLVWLLTGTDYQILRTIHVVIHVGGNIRVAM
jgi:hypothetical protein